ncbi:enoyl-CoA hydratase/isomerase family protein [Streptomyces sp. NPDC005373]|uniref:enoyl-CoA hydratase/isomerase family protein n=1 Tax=Streptomyces sp. NPDC005373 TaxID=3156879 RepID=UPI0033A08639
MEAPVKLVDLDRPRAQPPRNTPFKAKPSIVIGFATEPATVPVEAYDILLSTAGNAPRPWVACADPGATASRLADVVTERTEAAVALVQVLRMGRRLGLADRLVAESLAYSVLQGGAAFKHWLATAPRPSPRPSAQPVRLDRDGDRLSVTLDRPWVRNAIDAATRDALCEALTVVLADPSVARVDLRGNGPAFCSGGDLAEFGTSHDPARAHLTRVGQSAAALIMRCADRITAHVHGACVGAGIELTAFAHRIVAAPDTRIRLPELGMGLIPGAGGTASIPVRIGRHRTAYLALSGTSLTARQALAWGLVDEIVTGQDPQEAPPESVTAPH